MHAVGTNLKCLRIRAGLTQDALAGMLHVTRQTVSSWETGRTEPDLDTLLALAGALQSDVTELIYGVKRNGYRQYQRRWFICCAVCGVVLLGLLILQLTLVPALLARQNAVYDRSYALYQLCVPQFGFFAGGVLLCALASIWLPLRAAGKCRRWILAAGILLALPPLILTVCLPFIRSAEHLLWPLVRLLYPAISQRGGRFLMQQLAPFLSAICLFLGLNR